MIPKVLGALISSEERVVGKAATATAMITGGNRTKIAHKYQNLG
jgi:hypothetical protein